MASRVECTGIAIVKAPGLRGSSGDMIQKPLFYANITDVDNITDVSVQNQ